MRNVKKLSEGKEQQKRANVVEEFSGGFIRSSCSIIHFGICPGFWTRHHHWRPRACALYDETTGVAEGFVTAKLGDTQLLELVVIGSFEVASYDALEELGGRDSVSATGGEEFTCTPTY